MYLYNLGQVFERIVSENSDRVAIKFAIGGEITFAELNILSNKIANILLDNGIGVRDVVAIQNNKTAIGYASILACLKIGAIYTNFDPDNPKERLTKIFDTCRPKLIITDSDAVQSIKDLNIKIIELISIEFQNISSEIKIKHEVIGNNPAYIMFTSGSTGVPKGVVISHESVINFIKWAKVCYNITKDDVLTNVNPIYFDNSVFDFYSSIFNSASLAAFPKEIVANPKLLVSKIDELACTFWFSVPSMLVYLSTMRVLNKNNMKNIRIFSFGGEGYPKNSLKILYDLYSDRAEFFNVYGPTECTCICSAYKIEDKDFEDMQGLVTLGTLAPNFSYLLLDEEDKNSDIGELCLMGPQLALGYYNDLERTNQSFVQNPYNDKFEEKIYRTGDILRQVDGKLYFVGRKDNQIKHMGYRIELEEIEFGLNRLEYIQEAAVVYTKLSNGLGKIIAFVSCSKRLEEIEIRQDLRKYLPDYMIPNIFEFMDILPKNANGKIDRKFLKNSLLSVA